MERIDFSLIIACYNEERVLEKNVNRIRQSFEGTCINYEIIFVDDKSSDNTVDIARNIIRKHPGWHLIEHPKNMGRGRSVSDGIRLAKADIAGFTDIDLSTSPWYLPRLICEIESGADIATAFRVYKLRPRTFFRCFLSKGYNMVMRMMLGVSLKDTETGCKVFNRKRIMSILDDIKAEHWFWDTEVMVRSHLFGFKIVEVPTIFIREGLFTTVKIFKDTRRYIVNLIRFRKEIMRIRKKRGV